jgi:hypothetical protein
MRPFYLSMTEARAMFTQIVGVELSSRAAHDIVKRYVLTRPKRTYKKRGPKPKPKKGSNYKPKLGRPIKSEGRPAEPNSRRSVAKKKRMIKKIQATLARKKAADDW